MLNPEYYKNEINSFFDFDNPAPAIFNNVESLREEVKKREEFIRNKSLCVSCDILQFRAFFIKNKLLPSINDTVIAA